MLTRSQVANRLGKSIATVRRMEGELLFPVVDGSGVHRFDAEEVDLVAEEGATRALVAVYRGGQGPGRTREALEPNQSEFFCLKERLGKLKRRLEEKGAEVARLKAHQAKLQEALTLSTKLTVEAIRCLPPSAELELSVEAVELAAERLVEDQGGTVVKQ